MIMIMQTNILENRPRSTKAPSRRLRALFVVLFAGIAAPALAVEPFTADYNASYMGMEATGKMTLVPAGNERWKYSLDISGAGARLSQSTVFETNGGQWRPVSSTDSQGGETGLAAMLVKSRSVDATYDWSRGQATWTGDVKDGRAGPVKLKAGDLDGMLLNLALVRDFNAGQSLSYRLVEDGRIKNQVFTPSGTETIDVQGRDQKATKLVRSDGSRTITAWIVDGLPVPARILQQRDGRDHIDLKLKSFR